MSVAVAYFDWKPDRGIELGYQLWRRYYIDTELFDRSQPGRWSPYEPDCWLPAPAAAGACGRFAMRQRVRLQHAAWVLRLTPEQLREGQLLAVRMTHTQLVLDAARYPFATD